MEVEINDALDEQCPTTKKEVQEVKYLDEESDEVDSSEHIKEDDEDLFDPLALVKTELDDHNQSEEYIAEGSDSESSDIFSCEKCERTYVALSLLESHLKFCQGPKAPVVKVKPEEVTTDLQTLAHVVNGKKMYCCELCTYQTHRMKDVRRHLLTHTGAKPFKCEICDKAFSESSKLTEHKRIHSQEKPYKCTECDYAASQATSLKKHMTRHTGEKMYACKQCRYTTAINSHLVRHMRTHTRTPTEEQPRTQPKERLFSCTECEYKAAQSNTLKRHILAKHTDEKPYTCTYCDYKTAHDSLLKSHIQRIHGCYKTFSCVHCEFMTSAKLKLNQHMMKEHSNKST